MSYKQVGSGRIGAQPFSSRAPQNRPARTAPRNQPASQQTSSEKFRSLPVEYVADDTPVHETDIAKTASAAQDTGN